MQDFHSFLSLNDAVDHPIDMRLITIKKMPEPAIFRSYRAAIGKFFQGENGPLETFVPAPGGLGIWSIYVMV